MLRTRFSPITARPTRPMSDAFVILQNKSGSTGRVCLRAKTAGTILQYATQIGCASGRGAAKELGGGRQRESSSSSSSNRVVWHAWYCQAHGELGPYAGALKQTHTSRP